MNYKIILYSYNREFIELPLNKFLGNKLTSNKSVIQSYKYLMEIKIDDKDIDTINITVGDMLYRLKRKCEGIFYLEEKFFSCIWGYTAIIVEFLKSDSSEYYYSELIEVLLSNEDYRAAEVEKSLNLMLEYIIDKKVSLLDIPVRHKFSIVQKSLKKSKIKTLRTEIELLEKIIECYKKNVGYFMRDLRYRLVNKNNLENFENIAQINIDTINYIISHPEELYSVNYETGIKMYNQSYIPKKTLTTIISKDYNIYENKMVLGFVLSLIKYVNKRVSEAECFLKKHDSPFSIKKITNHYYSWYVQQMKYILINMENIYYQYKEILKCEIINVTTLCPATNIFLNYSHYRQIYIIMKKWFESGNYDFQDDDIMSDLLSTDQIYEYYCLLNLIDNIEELGFRCINKTNYLYKDCNYTYLGNNTFEYTDGSSKITLYYQPIYYSDRFENNITLFRTSKDNRNRESWYSPDFIIKINTNNEIRYIILDSKWQERKNIENYTFKDIIYKYVFSVETCKDSLLHSVCILQGRDDNKTIYRHQTGQLSEQMGIFSQPQVNIIPFTPKKYSKGYILQILKGALGE